MHSGACACERQSYLQSASLRFEPCAAYRVEPLQLLLELRLLEPLRAVLGERGAML